MAQTTSDWPAACTPAANTFDAGAVVVGVGAHVTARVAVHANASSTVATERTNPYSRTSRPGSRIPSLRARASSSGRWLRQPNHSTRTPTSFSTWPSLPTSALVATDQSRSQPSSCGTTCRSPERPVGPDHGSLSSHSGGWGSSSNCVTEPRRGGCWFRRSPSRCRRRRSRPRLALGQRLAAQAIAGDRLVLLAQEVHGVVHAGQLAPRHRQVAPGSPSRRS